jgi:hypothetical protein
MPRMNGVLNELAQMNHLMASVGDLELRAVDQGTLTGGGAATGGAGGETTTTTRNP